MARRVFVLALLGTLALGAAPVLADEAKAPVSASMLLTIMSAPLEARETAFNRSLMDPGPSPRSPLAEVLPDGSVKIDRAIVTVRNPCPPGTTHYEPVPLPGRRAKN
jgi:hypothetical protein